MSAIACLRVVIEPDAVSLPESALGPLVEKLTSAFLETRWAWPREFSPLNSYSFLLVDPRADTLDIRELVNLSEELQIKFFGQSNTGKVALLLFEGSEEAARTFGAMDGEQLARARSDPAQLPSGGRLAQIFTEDLVTQTVAEPAPAPDEDAESGLVQRVRLHGVYFRLRNVFIGEVISCLSENRREQPSITDGFERLPRDPERFDAVCTEAAILLLRDARVKSMLYVPMSYDSLVRPSLRAALLERLSQVPAERRGQVTATVYGVPRDPPFGAMMQIRSTLGDRVNAIDLRVDDPDFEVEKLPPQVVAGVSFALPTGDRRARLAALRHFTRHRHAYKQRRIWASVTNVRDFEELAACEALGVPFLTGPAICDAQTAPLAGRVVPLEQLPVQTGGLLSHAARRAGAGH